MGCCNAKEEKVKENVIELDLNDKTEIHNQESFREMNTRSKSKFGSELIYAQPNTTDREKLSSKVDDSPSLKESKIEVNLNPQPMDQKSMNVALKSRFDQKESDENPYYYENLPHRLLKSEYHTYQKFNYKEERKNLKKTINIKSLIQNLENHMLGKSSKNENEENENRNNLNDEVSSSRTSERQLYDLKNKKKMIIAEFK